MKGLFIWTRANGCIPLDFTTFHFHETLFACIICHGFILHSMTFFENGPFFCNQGVQQMIRITNRVFTDLAIWMMGFGILVGLVFPFFMLLLGLDASIALSW